MYLLNFDDKWISNAKQIDTCTNVFLENIVPNGNEHARRISLLQ